jgi:radical SAM superfamily enzyme YgiQ (UPF0313 family)
MKISLIFTPNQLNTNFQELIFRDESIGFVPPLSLMYVASLMEKEGVEVDLIDMDAECLNYQETLDRLKRFAPDLMGFTTTTSSFHPVLKWIKQFKSDTGIPVLIGGEHVRLYPLETMSHQSIDYCIVGEAELPLPEFIRAVREGGAFDGIKSVGFRRNGEVVIDRTLQTIANIDDVPYPAQHLIKNELYENILTRRKNFTAMISTRGCPFRCAFCCQNQQKYRTRSPMSFVDEIERNLKEFSVRDFDIYDSTFTADRKRVIRICAEIVRRGLKVGFTVRSRVDVVTKEMIDSLKAAGCHTIMYGIESSSPEILKRMNKGISPQRVEEIVKYTNLKGIETLGFFMFGFPGETCETIEDTIRFSLRLPLDYAQFTVLLPFPETEIYAYYRERGIEDYWAEYTLEESKERLIDLIDTGVTREEASRYVAKAYKRFYFRPRIIWKRAMKLGSFSEFMRLARGAIGILVNSRKKK